MDQPPIDALLQDLHHPESEVRDRATQQLWQRWFQQKGMVGLRLLQQAEMLLEAGELTQAETLLTQVTTDLPDFAEAWNRRAVLYFTMGRYRKAIADCQQVIQLNPVHFGALHGLGLCHAALGEYSAAIGAFRRALEIQPYALENQRLILECTARLS